MFTQLHACFMCFPQAIPQSQALDKDKVSPHAHAGGASPYKWHSGRVELSQSRKFGVGGDKTEEGKA